MPRTTINIDAPILKDLKRLQRKEGKPLGQLVSELLGQALAQKRADQGSLPFHWTARTMNARVDIEDKEALRAASDRGEK